MSVKKRLIPAFIASALALGAPAVQATSFNGVYVFGDSLADSGYYRPFLVGALGYTPAQAAALGRFTTNPGPVWSELIATYYGGNPNPSNAGGGIYAQGGARITATSTSTPPGFAQRPVSQQITEFLATGAANPNALYAIWAGGNDLLQAGAAGVPFAAQIPVQTARLQAAGARYIAVFGLPNLGLTPGAQAGGPAAVAAQTQASVGFNITLFNALAASGQKVMAIDSFSLLNEIAASPGTYGFSNITNVACNPTPPLGLPQCGPANLVAPGAQNSYLFADSIHPTAGAHAIIADLVKSMIDGPNAYSTMAEVPLATRAAHIRTLDEGLRSGASAEVGKATAFAAADGGKFDISSGAQNLYTDSKSRTGTVGATMRVTDTTTLGAAAGLTSADTNMGSIGKYRLKETTMSVFGSYKDGDFYLNASGSLAELRYEDIERYVRLGPATRTNRATTKGTNASASIALGYDFQLGRVSVGPFASYTLQSVSVTGFTENASATPQSTDLRLEDQSRDSQVTSIGLRASMAFGNWTPFARISLDRDGKAKDRDVTATPVSIAQNISYNVPGYRADDAWSTATIGVRGKISNQISLAIAYSNVMSRRDIKQDGVTANLSFAF